MVNNFQKEGCVDAGQSISSRPFMGAEADGGSDESEEMEEMPDVIKHLEMEDLTLNKKVRLLSCR